MESTRETDLIAMGFGSDPSELESLKENCEHENPRFRQLAISALIRRSPEIALEIWSLLSVDADWHVRRRIAELGIDLGIKATDELLKLTLDDSNFVREMACFSLGEIFENAEDFSFDDSTLEKVIGALIENAKNEDPLVRESAIASLGNIGDDRAREIVIAACSDKAPIRRRAVVALAAFEGQEVEDALDLALDDVDWQVRQAAEDISGKVSPKE